MGLGTVGISRRWLIAEYLRCSTLPGAGGPFHLFFAGIHSPLLLSYSVPCIHTSPHCSLPAAVLAWNSRPQHKGQKKKKGVFISRLIYCSQSQNKNTTFWKRQALGRKVSSLNWRCPVTRTLFKILTGALTQGDHVDWKYRFKSDWVIFLVRGESVGYLFFFNWLTECVIPSKPWVITDCFLWDWVKVQMQIISRMSSFPSIAPVLPLCRAELSWEASWLWEVVIVPTVCPWGL